MSKRKSNTGLIIVFFLVIGTFLEVLAFTLSMPKGAKWTLVVAGGAFLIVGIVILMSEVISKRIL